MARHDPTNLAACIAADLARPYNEHAVDSLRKGMTALCAYSRIEQSAQPDFETGSRGTFTSLVMDDSKKSLLAMLEDFPPLYLYVLSTMAAGFNASDRIL